MEISTLPAEIWGLFQPFVQILAGMGLTGLVIAYLLFRNYLLEQRSIQTKDENSQLAREAVKMASDVGAAITRITDAAIRGDFSRLKLPSDSENGA